MQTVHPGSVVMGGLAVLLGAIAAFASHTWQQLEATHAVLDEVVVQRASLRGAVHAESHRADSLGAQLEAVRGELTSAASQLTVEQRRLGALRQELLACRQPEPEPIERVSSQDAFVVPVAPASSGRDPIVVPSDAPPAATITPRPPPSATIRPVVGEP